MKKKDTQKASHQRKQRENEGPVGDEEHPEHIKYEKIKTYLINFCKAIGKMEVRDKEKKKEVTYLP